MSVRYLSAERMAALVGNKFGHPCPVHSRTVRGNLCVYFCLDCRALQQEAMCCACQEENHPSHRMLQVFKVSMNEVVRVPDIKGVIDIEGIQQYKGNGFKCVFLMKRYAHRGSMCPLRQWASCVCITCKYPLIGEAHFCSISCKLEMEARCHPDITGCIEWATEFSKEVGAHNHPETGCFEGRVMESSKEVDAPRPSENNRSMRGVLTKYRNVHNLYNNATRVAKRQKIIDKPKRSIKTKNDAAPSTPSLRPHDATAPMCSLNKEAPFPNNKSPRKGRPVHAPFYSGQGARTWNNRRA